MDYEFEFGPPKFTTAPPKLDARHSVRLPKFTTGPPKLEAKPPNFSVEVPSRSLLLDKQDLGPANAEAMNG
jgi:hypothetical protein